MLMHEIFDIYIYLLQNKEIALIYHLRCILSTYITLRYQITNMNISVRDAIITEIPRNFAKTFYWKTIFLCIICWYYMCN